MSVSINAPAPGVPARLRTLRSGSLRTGRLPSELRLGTAGPEGEIVLHSPKFNSASHCWGGPIHHAEGWGSPQPRARLCPPPRRAVPRLERPIKSPAHVSPPVGFSILLPPRSPCAGSGRARTPPGQPHCPQQQGERAESCSPSPAGTCSYPGA